MKKIILFIALFTLITACMDMNKKSGITPESIEKVINELLLKGNSDKTMIEKSVKQVAKLWQDSDGTNEEFVTFCLDNYISNPEEKERTFLKISEYLEAIYGNFNEMSLQLRRNVDEVTGPLLGIDEQFAAYNPSAHLSDDLYANKIAFLIALNFPELSLQEKESLGKDRLAWAYARLGDMFTSRVPASLQQAFSAAISDADMYISNYNIYVGHLFNQEGKKIFPEDMILLSHWNLRDEIKANYNQGNEGLDKQQTIYEVMQRIISQEIPKEVINSGDYEWNPFTNEVSQSGKQITGTPEDVARYQKILNNFKALQAIDKYTGNTYIERNFSKDTEISVEDTEELFRNFLSSPELKEVGKMIEQRLGRKLQAFDIWYDGFKARSNLNEETLSAQTRKIYPDAKAFENRIPSILMKLGFTSDRANYLSEKITVDAARGSGHAWGGQMKGQQAHLRTRIPADGMDYKGYNIATHELGHNVEQTISLYDVDYYMLNGVPSTAFTEALAFVFQKRDLELLGVKNDDPEKEKLNVLDKIWHLYEISGVSMLDIAVWKWLYANPDATAEQLRDAVVRLSKEIWNEYFASVFGIKDQTILAIYSHTVSYPLYLSAYAFGQIIEFQLEQYITGKDFAKEVGRIFRIGRLTPNQWMLEATGEPLSTEALLGKVRAIIQ